MGYGHGKVNRDAVGKAFGWEDGFACVPAKYSWTKISRLINGTNMGCMYCFPHGRHTANNKYKKDTKCWKTYRKTHYRTCKEETEITEEARDL